MSQILITGANRGIGLALTQELLSSGHQVFAGARRPSNSKELQDLKSKFPEALEIVPLDITSDSSVAEALKSVESKTGSLDILVNNAGLFPEEGDESLLEIDLQHFRDAFETNVIGTLRVSRVFLPLLKKGKNPRLVNISSLAGSISDKTDSAYYAYSTSKAALNMATRAMAAELGESGISVVAMSPGWVKTDMGGPNVPLSPQESTLAIANTILDLGKASHSKFIDRSGKEIDGW